MRVDVKLSIPTDPPPVITVSFLLCYLTRGLGLQPWPEDAAVIQAAAALSHTTFSHVIMISHTITGREHDPAHFRAGCPGLNQQSAPAGLRDVGF